jgi:hypothetical protein
MSIVMDIKNIMAGYPLCLPTLSRDCPLPCQLLPKIYSLQHYLETLKPSLNSLSADNILSLTLCFRSFSPITYHVSDYP